LTEESEKERKQKTTLINRKGVLSDEAHLLDKSEVLTIQEQLESLNEEIKSLEALLSEKISETYNSMKRSKHPKTFNMEIFIKKVAKSKYTNSTSPSKEVNDIFNLFKKTSRDGLETIKREYKEKKNELSEVDRLNIRQEIEKFEKLIKR
jgi:hypothetical protein